MIATKWAANVDSLTETLRPLSVSVCLSSSAIITCSMQLFSRPFFSAAHNTCLRRELSAAPALTNRRATNSFILVEGGEKISDSKSIHSPWKDNNKNLSLLLSLLILILPLLAFNCTLCLSDNLVGWSRHDRLHLSCPIRTDDHHHNHHRDEQLSQETCESSLHNSGPDIIIINLMAKRTGNDYKICSVC